uniref:RGS domain-containing protein n=1 Tax=Panagrolaimus sp. PS1159 TaxID=55785 RepID=A0AC35FNV1_9BILA
MSKITNGLLRKFNKKKDLVNASAVQNETNNKSDISPKVQSSTVQDETNNKSDISPKVQSNNRVSISFENHMVTCLNDVFKIPNAQLLFIQFMESVDRLNLVKFYLHVESFKASFLSKSILDTELLNVIKTDACNIFSQYVCADATMNLNLSEALRKRVIESVCQKDGSITANCFDEAQNYVWNQLENRYYKEFLASVFYSKYLLEIYTNGDLNINDILKTHSLLCTFLEFLEDIDDNYGQNLLEFIICIRDSEQAKGADAQTLVDDAIVIYDKYFSMQATNSLNFDDTIRIEIESKICTDSGIPEPNAYEKPYNLACASLQENYIPNFLKSSPFQKLIHGLSVSIETQYDTHNTVAQYVSTIQRSPSTQLPPSSPSWIAGLRSSRNRTQSFDRMQSTPRSVCRLRSSKNRTQSFDRIQSTPRSVCSNISDDGPEETESQCSTNSLTFMTPNIRSKKTHGSLARVDELGRYTPLFNKDVCGPEELPGRGRLRSAIDRYLNNSADKQCL